MASVKKLDDIISINVGGKKFTIRRTTLTADPKSRLGDWFKTINPRGIPQDKAGNYFLDRDGKSFRYILDYLRLKKEGNAISFALPLKPDELAKLIGEAEALRLQELKDLCLEMLQKYQREEANYVAAFINHTLAEHEDLGYDKGKGRNTTDDYDAGYD